MSRIPHKFPRSTLETSLPGNGRGGVPAVPFPGGEVEGERQDGSAGKREGCIHHPVVTTITLTSTISVTFTTITLTSTISVITTIISRRTEQHPRFPLSPSLHGRPSQETAEETTPQEGGRPRQSVPQNA
ncbi:hypothetical protein NFI96_027594 [Prochilodus magdalenae]|nr:hypothetical protein NFI96_027594 [Prochilodus magdalenae]